MCEPSTGEIVACTSQNAGVPLVVFTGTVFDETIPVCAIDIDASALHASCADTIPDDARAAMAA